MHDDRLDALQYMEAYLAREDAARQTRLESFIEACINVLIGFWINFAANLLILPAFGFTSLSLGTNFAIGALYTAVSVVRSYAIRRWAQDHLRTLKRRLAAYVMRLAYRTS